MSGKDGRRLRRLKCTLSRPSDSGAGAGAGACEEIVLGADAAGNSSLPVDQAPINLCPATQSPPAPSHDLSLSYRGLPAPVPSLPWVGNW